MGLLFSLSDFRKHNKETMDVSRRLGRQQMLGLCCDAINRCRAEKEARGDATRGYWEALFDLNAKLLEIQRAEDPT